jgi:hypothetical protein
MKHYDWIKANKTSGKGFGKGYTKAALNARDKEHDERKASAREWLCRHLCPNCNKKTTTRKKHTLTRDEMPSHSHRVPRD